MINTIIEFTTCCRSYGLRVSTSEVLDSICHISLINPIDENEFKTVLKSNYAKSRRDQSRFNSLYDLFFHGVKPVNSANSFTHLADTFNEIMDIVKKNQDNIYLDIDIKNSNNIDELKTNSSKSEIATEAIIEFMSGKPAQFLDMIHRLNIMAIREQKFFKSNMDQLSSKLVIMLVINQMRARINRLIGTNFDNLDIKSTQILNINFNKILDSAYSLLTDEPRENNETLLEKKYKISDNEQLSQRAFSSLSASEIAQVMEIIELFTKKLKDQATRRFRVKKRGNIDIKRTLRNAEKYQGVPLDIRFKDKPLNKSSLIILCDISGSVWSSAKFMLNILYTLQECFKRVRSFVFVAELAEITDYFEKNVVNNDYSQNRLNRAIDLILNSNIVNISEHTDYGAAFSSFKRNYQQILNHKTTIIIMGDGRSNYLNPQAHILGEIREKCRRIIWLNPEPHNTWNSGDSEIFCYKPHCHEIRTCMNLKHLTEFVQELVV